jgi:hypothetical protein
MIVEKNMPFVALLWYKGKQYLEGKINKYVRVYGKVQYRSGGLCYLYMGPEEISIGLGSAYTTRKIDTSLLYEMLGHLSKTENGEYSIVVLFYKETKLPIELLEKIYAIKNKVNEECEEKIKNEKTLRFESNYV